MPPNWDLQATCMPKFAFSSLSKESGIGYAAGPRCATITRGHINIPTGRDHVTMQKEERKVHISLSNA